MASRVQCDACGKVISYKEAKHLRISKMTDCEHYSTTALQYIDICDDCYKATCQLLKMEAKGK